MLAGASIAISSLVDEGIWLNGFQLQRPAHESDQQQLLDWIAEMHAGAAAALDGLSRTERDDLRERLTRVISRCACSPSQIAKRGHVDRSFYGDGGAHGPDTHARTHAFVEIADDIFDALYADEPQAPRDLIHVTCTGYASPSAAQELVARKGWGAQTRVTHAYHMGCYAALPAVRLAAGMLCAPGSKCSEHTSVCTMSTRAGLAGAASASGAHSMPAASRTAGSAA